jgi:hypothetical protein
VVRVRRLVVLLASAALTVLLACGVAFAEEKLDQKNAGPVKYSSDYEEFNSDEQYLAQGFTAGKSGTLSKVSVRIKGCSPQLKDINVRIYWIDSSGYWVPTPLTSTTLPASQ